MKLEGTRFGGLEVDDERVITFPRGLVGFAAARRFVLLEPKAGARIAWLQSLDVPALAFPVVPSEELGTEALPETSEIASQAGLSGDDLHVLVVVTAAGAGVTPNMMAPLVVDSESRQGVQVVLDPKRNTAPYRGGAARRAHAAREMRDVP